MDASVDAAKRGPRQRLLAITHAPPPKFHHPSVVDPPWLVPGVDITDFFNYGFNPETWKDYMGLVHQFRVEFTMQKRIRTFDGPGGPGPGGAEADLPPELRAAVAADRAGPGWGGPGRGPPMRPMVRRCGVLGRATLRLAPWLG